MQIRHLDAFWGIIFLLFSCASPNEEEITPAELKLKGISESIEVGAGSSQVPISFSTNKTWTASSDSPWISLSSSKGAAGDAAILAAVEENTSGNERTGKVTVTAGNVSKSVLIRQAQAGPSANESLVITARVSDYSTFTVSVTTNTTRSYFFDVVEKSVWDKDGGEAVWKSLFKKDKVLTKNGSREYTDQKPKTEYLAFAAFCDANGTKTGGFFTEAFVTDTGLGGDDPVPIELSVSNLTGTSFTLTASSRSSDRFYCDAVKKSVWDEYGGEVVWKAYVQAGLEAGTFVDELVVGEVSYDYHDLETDKYIAFAAYCYTDGTLKSTIFTKEIDLTNTGQSSAVERVSINTNLALLLSESRKLTVKCYDSDFYPIENAKVKWTSSNPSVASVDQDGVVMALGIGTSTITATAVNGTASDEVFVYVVPNYNQQPVDLGLSVKWAQYNIGANRPEGYGSYYTWGATETWSSVKNTSPYSHLSSYWQSHKDEIVDENSNLYRSKDPVKHLVGKNWRMPTKNEFEELLEKCSYEMITLNGRYGCLFKSKQTGYTDKWLFFPCTDVCWAGDRADPERNHLAFYWSSTVVNYAIYNYWSYEPAWGLYIETNSNTGINCDYRRTGCPVRPVYSEELYVDLIISDVTSSQAIVTMGTNSSDTYYMNIVSKSLWDAYGGDSIWEATVKLATDAGSFASNLLSGDTSFKYTDLSPQTEYVFFAAFCDQNGTRNGKMYSRAFKTN